MAPIIAATAQSGWQRLIPLLQAAGLPDPVDAEVKPENLEARQREADPPAALLFYTRPEKILAHAMERDEDPAAALAEWSASAERVLQAYRRNRRNAMILDVEEAAVAPQAFLRALAERLQLSMPAEPPAAEQDETEGGPTDPVIALIATQWVTADPQVAPMFAELAASTLPLRHPASPQHGDCANVWQEYRTALQERRDDSRVQELQEENELLLLQLHQVQEELESYYLEAKDKEEQQRKAAEEAENLKKRRDELKRDNDSLQERVARLERNLSDIKNSASWKLTVPLRAVRGGPRHRGDNTREGRS